MSNKRRSVTARVARMKLSQIKSTTRDARIFKYWNAALERAKQKGAKSRAAQSAATSAAALEFSLTARQIQRILKLWRALEREGRDAIKGFAANLHGLTELLTSIEIVVGPPGLDQLDQDSEIDAFFLREIVIRAARRIAYLEAENKKLRTERDAAIRAEKKAQTGLASVAAANIYAGRSLSR